MSDDILKAIDEALVSIGELRVEELKNGIVEGGSYLRKEDVIAIIEKALKPKK